jgi:hypothetical protein
MANPYFAITWTDCVGTSTSPSPQTINNIIAFHPDIIPQSSPLR